MISCCRTDFYSFSQHSSHTVPSYVWSGTQRQYSCSSVATYVSFCLNCEGTSATRNTFLFMNDLRKTVSLRYYLFCFHCIIKGQIFNQTEAPTGRYLLDAKIKWIFCFKSEVVTIGYRRPCWRTDGCTNTSCRLCCFCTLPFRFTILNLYFTPSNEGNNIFLH